MLPFLFGRCSASGAGTRGSSVRARVRPSTQSLPVADTAVAVVLMSQGLVYDPVALGAVASIKRAGLGALTVLSQEGFWKPDEDYFTQLRMGQLRSSSEMKVVNSWL